MKKSLLAITILSTILIAGCSFTKKVNNHDWDDFVVCTEEEKNASACNLNLDLVCGDNEKTYDNACLACASQEIEWYFAWACYDSCDNEEWICTAEDLLNEEENTEDNAPVVSAPSSQVVGIELTVVAPDEENTENTEEVEEIDEEIAE